MSRRRCVLRGVLAGALCLGSAAVLAAEPKNSASAGDATLRRGDAYFHLMQARLALGDGRASEAASEINEAVGLLPDSPDLLAQGAGLLAAAGRRADAEKMARRSVELAPDTWTGVRVLADLAAGRAFGNQGDPAARDEAIRLYERIAQSDPTAGADVYAALARLKMQAGDGAGAAAAARQFLRRRPGDEVAIRLLVQALVTDGKIGEASKEALDWLRQNPDAADLLPAAAEIARQAADWERLEQTCSVLLQGNPGDPRILAARGEARLRQGRPLEAIPDLEKARAAAPDDVMARLHLAAAYNGADRLADGVALSRELVAEYPDNPGVRSLLGEGLARQGDLAGALDAFTAAVRAIPGKDDLSGARRDELRERIAGLWLARKNPDEAGRVLEGLEYPEDPSAIELKARAAIAGGHADEARRLAGQIGEKGEPGIAAAIRAEADLAEKKFDAAREHFDRAVELLGPGFRGQAAESLRAAGETAAAEDILRGWVRAEPGNAEARFRLGALYERDGKYKEAEAEVREALQLRPRFSEALNYLGYSLADRNERLDEAEDLIRRALEIDPYNGAYLDSLGWVLYRKAKYAESLGPLEKAAREFPRDATVLEHLGDALQRLGKNDLARDAWRRAVEAGSDDAESLRRKIDQSAEAGAAGPARRR